MKKFFFLFLTLCLSLSAQKPHEAYIQQFSQTAIEEMYRSGIPASITLAQGLLESDAGRSYLSTQGNNHFGIKCHRDWKGESVFYDDDKKGECFRKYKHAEESYRDHSDFIRYRDRYKFLFDYDIKDYRSWAAGLKKAGYATDPAYATKLIRLIENYNLMRFDSMKPEGKSAAKLRKEDKREGKGEELSIPESPLKLEEAEIMNDAQGEFTFSLQRPIYTKNRVPFVYAQEGETYESIAEDFNLFRAEIYRFNDVKPGLREPLPGEVVYVQAKRKATARGLDKYVVNSPDESLWAISQRYGITMASLMKRNGLNENYFLTEGDVLKLR
ncbi:MAG: glucosaminidase domain-containing protein [Bacteroidales bacterium]|nr:glucosaminidase domain-containing protein [Bacteroidales bacterium]